MADSGSPIFNERGPFVPVNMPSSSFEGRFRELQLSEDTCMSSSRFGVWFIETTCCTFDGRSASFSVFFQPLSQPEQADASVRSCSSCSY